MKTGSSLYDACFLAKVSMVPLRPWTMQILLNQSCLVSFGSQPRTYSMLGSGGQCSIVIPEKESPILVPFHSFRRLASFMSRCLWDFDGQETVLNKKLPWRATLVRVTHKLRFLNISRFFEYFDESRYFAIVLHKLVDTFVENLLGKAKRHPYNAERRFTLGLPHADSVAGA